MLLNIDPSLCTGCQACEVYCSLAHEGLVRPLLSNIQVHQSADRRVIVPVTCIPCDEKACLAACPEPGALKINELGVVVIIESLCTGCSRCVRACAIEAIHMHRLAGRGKKGRAAAFKCDQCSGDPWCVRVCPTGAITRLEASSGGQVIFNRLVTALVALAAAGSPGKDGNGA